MSSTFSNILSGVKKALSPSGGNGKGMSWLTIKKLKHYSTGPERVYMHGHRPIHYIHPWDLYMSYEEIFVHEIYRMELPENALVLDCGANIGLASLYLKETCPTARVIAFEPDEKNFELLGKNVSGWKLPGIEIRKQAVWKEHTTLLFSGSGDMASRVLDQGQGVQVQAVRLKDLLNERVAFLKLDIEGAEYEVLLDIEDSLHMVERMFFEYHGRFSDTNKLTRVFDILTKAGFQYYIKEATSVYGSPFHIERRAPSFDVQLNIFCFREDGPGGQSVKPGA